MRQAIAYAINRDALVNRASRRRGGRQAVPAAGRSPATPTTSRTYDYDPDKAKELLAEAGESNLTLNFYYPTEVTRPYMPNPKDIFTVISADLQKAGITVKPVRARCGTPAT